MCQSPPDSHWASRSHTVEPDSEPDDDVLPLVTRQVLAPGQPWRAYASAASGSLSCQMIQARCWSGVQLTRVSSRAAPARSRFIQGCLLGRARERETLQSDDESE